jgi:hypothetical protein
MKKQLLLLLIIAMYNMNCKSQDDMNNTDNVDIKGYELLTDLSGHWVGDNLTAFGYFDWFAFDFRPISASHLHSIYEGGTNQNIITSIFIADFEGEKQIMARNGGWLGNQYRATYFVLDSAEVTNNVKYYRLVDAIGKEKRAFMELKFENDTLFFDAYKDNGGSLDEPIHHMGFKGTNYNPSFAQAATDLFDFPQKVSEVDLENKFVNLIDEDSALFLEESDDPFPKSEHRHLSDLKINISKDNSIADDALLLYISTERLIDESGQVNFDNLDKKVVRTIDIQSNEAFYETTYLHPDTYYITVFTDKDNNFYPSQGDVANVSKLIEVTPESQLEMEVMVNLLIP